MDFTVLAKGIALAGCAIGAGCSLIAGIGKEEMLRLDTEELNAGAYILRYTSVISNRFDSTTFKRLYADLYKDFTKPISSRRFTVSC